MIILEYKIEELFNLIFKTGNSLYKTIRAEEIDWEEVELKTSLMKTTFDQLSKLLDGIKSDRVRAFYRHISFILKDPKANGEANLRDVLDYDLPEIRRLYLEKLKGFPYLDTQLKEECENLLLNCEYDSVIRKAFVVFKDRAVKKFNLPSNLDGEVLVNRLFSPDKGLIQVSDEKDKREAFRNFCVGLFQYFRNAYAHNLIDNPEYVVETVISSINMILKTMDTYGENTRQYENNIRRDYGKHYKLPELFKVIATEMMDVSITEEAISNTIKNYMSSSTYGK